MLCIFKCNRNGSNVFTPEGWRSRCRCRTPPSIRLTHKPFVLKSIWGHGIVRLEHDGVISIICMYGIRIHTDGTSRKALDWAMLISSRLVLFAIHLCVWPRRSLVFTCKYYIDINGHASGSELILGESWEIPYISFYLQYFLKHRDKHKSCVG